MRHNVETAPLKDPGPSCRSKVIRGNVLQRRVSWSKLVARHGFAGFHGHEDIKVTNLYARSHDDALTLAAAAMDKYAGR